MWKGCLLDNEELAEALEQRTEFTNEEWDGFGIKGGPRGELEWSDYVEVHGSFFKPAPGIMPEGGTKAEKDTETGGKASKGRVSLRRGAPSKKKVD